MKYEDHNANRIETELKGVADRIVEMIMSRKALAAGVPVVTRNHKTPVASAIPLTGIGELSQ